MIKQYMIAEAISLHELTNFVNMYIQQGWEPFGNLVCIQSEWFIQPMVLSAPDIIYEGYTNAE